MELQERPSEQREPTAPVGGGGGNLDALRQAAQAFSSAGDEAIRRALSADSQAFNMAVRQEGGQ